MHIEVPRTHTHDRAHRVATAVEEKVRKTLPNSNVLVHVEAIESSSETIIDRIRLIATEIEGIRDVHSIIYLSSIPSPSDEGMGYGKEERVQPEKKSLAHLQKITEIPSSSSSSPLHLYLDVQMENSLDLSAAHKVR